MIETEARLRERYSDVMGMDELLAKYKVIGFTAPYCLVEDKSTGEQGSVCFIHYPRLYYNFKKIC